MVEHPNTPDSKHYEHFKTKITKAIQDDVVGKIKQLNSGSLIIVCPHCETNNVLTPTGFTCTSCKTNYILPEKK